MPDKAQIPAGWKRSTIGEHVRFEGGTQPPRSTFIFEERPGYIRLVQTRDFKTDKHKTYIPRSANHKTFNEQDVMIGRYGPPVFQIYRGLSGAYNVALIKASPKSDALLNDYLYYTLKQDCLFNLIDSLSRRSSGQTGVDMDALKDYRLPLPPLREQDQITRLLRTWDQAIENLELLIEKMQQRQGALTHSLVFGGRQLGNFNISNSRRSFRWFETPDNWEVKPIGKLALEVSERNGNGEDHEVLSCTKYDGFVRSLEYFKKQVFSDDLTGYKKIWRGDFGFPSNHVEEGSIGIQNLTDIGVVSPIYTIFRFKPDVIDNDYAIAVLKTSLYRHIFEVSTSASVDRRGSLRWGEFSKIPFPVPPIAEQRAIAEVLKMHLIELNILRKEREALSQQKRGLVQKLLTGEWRVSARATTEAAE